MAWLPPAPEREMSMEGAESVQRTSAQFASATFWPSRFTRRKALEGRNEE